MVFFQKKRLSLITTSQSNADIQNNGPLSCSFHATSSTRFSPRNSISDHDDQVKVSSPHFSQPSSLGADEKINRKETTKTASLDRSNDAVYGATTNVVKAIMTLTQGVEKAAAADYLDLVRNVGIELRALLSSVDALSSIFPAQAHK